METLLALLMEGIRGFLAILAIAYLAFNAFLLVECILALLPSSLFRQSQQESQLPSFVVLMPAHNEASVIRDTLSRLLPEVDRPEQVVVVADNCQDETAEIARNTGVSVLERSDTKRRGKGYALDYGLQMLADAPPDVVVMLDADCWVTPGTIQRIARAAFQSGHPTQAVYLMEQPANPTLKDRVSAFAWTVKNRVRASGLSRLGGPIMLGGTGMAFPWSALQQISLASGHIVEDMKLGMDLAIAGYKTSLQLDSQVMGILPDDEAAATSQRTRWEHGHLGILKTYVPKLLVQSIRQFRPSLILLALDLAIPPLALWSILGIGITGLTAGAALLGIATLPLHIQLAADSLLLGAILICWVAWGRRVLSFSQLIAIPVYILWKIPIYIGAIFNPQKSWVRTKRNT